MTFGIILTSYNRGPWLREAIRSVLRQSFEDWNLLIMDDYSTDEETLEVLRTLGASDKRVTVHRKRVRDRAAKTRYSVLINRAYRLFPSPPDWVIHQCDNVTYRPGLLQAVADWAKANPDAASVYWPHARFIADAAGNILGPASLRRHWNFTPPDWARGKAIEAPGGLLDHSQVAARWPFDARWPEGIEFLKSGDARFFELLVGETGAIPMMDGQDAALSDEYLIYD